MSSLEGSMEELGKLDVTKLHPLSPEVISLQATINIGIIGHGKSALVKALSDVETVRFKNELEHNTNIKPGYTNAKIFKCSNEKCPPPMCYKSYGSAQEDNPLCDECHSRMELLRHVSFVDCPGHYKGGAIMDGALLLIAADERFPQRQSSEHMAALEAMNLKHIIIVLNKLDLTTENIAMNQCELIQKYIQGTVAEGAPIVPIVPEPKCNIDSLCEYIMRKIPAPQRNLTSPPQMIVFRSFDVNTAGSDWREIKGGVVGGSILQGVLKLNQMIEIRPGAVLRDERGKWECTPIFSRIVSLYAEQKELQFAVPGGLIEVGTTMDPTLTRADRLVGQVLGEVGSLPEVYVELEVRFFLLRRLLGVKMEMGKSKGDVLVSNLKKGEELMLNIGCMRRGARVVAVKDNWVKLQLLTLPVCTSLRQKIEMKRRLNMQWMLIGWGYIESGSS